VSDTSDETPGYAECAALPLSSMISLGNPRHVLVTRRPWMNAYCSLDAGELSFRLKAVSEQTEGFNLWLWCLALFRTAFNHPYTLTDDRIDDETPGPLNRSEEFRLNILGLAGGNVKLAMDAALAGYYNGCLALERHMLETWCRSAYARLRPEDIWRWFPVELWPEGMIPAENKDDASLGKMPTWPPGSFAIAKIIKKRGDDWDKLFHPKVVRGYRYLNAHVHPTLEGASQMWEPGNSNRHVFGPTFEGRLCAWCVHWGLFSGVVLLWEVARLKFQGDAWVAELGELTNAVGAWGNNHPEQLVIADSDRSDRTEIIPT
jgi:hypothetical protein